MMELMFFSVMVFFKPVMFVFLFIIMVFLMMNNMSWMGIFLLIDSYIYVLLIFMMIFIHGIVMLSEVNYNILLLSEMLVMISMMFFVSSNMLMLYMFFEMSMFPILVMILGFGSQIEKINSSYYLLFYASLCSFPFLFVYFKSNMMLSLCYFNFFLSWEMFFILTLCFMMKFPVYFLHLWLPKAHVEAPTSASMLLAGLLLKLGTCGFLRLMKSMSFNYNNVWIYISLVGMILAAVCCVFQSDSKSLAAYSSITHMSFLLLSLSMMMISTKTASLMMMLAHGYTSTLMFYLIGEYYHLSNSRMVYFMNSFMMSSLMMSIVFMMTFLSNSGIPPSLSFLSEFMIIINSFIYSKMMFFLIFIYFMVTFYYSLFLIVNSFMGKMFMNFNNWNMGIVYMMIFMMYNIFWLTMMY